MNRSRRTWTFADALLARAFRSGTFWKLTIRVFQCCFGLQTRGAENVPRGSALIFVGNHGSHFDGIFAVAMVHVLQGVEPSVVAFSRAGDFPFTRQMANTGALDLIFADPLESSPRARAAVLRSMIDRLKAGRTVIIFAEGHRRDTLGEFNGGAAAAARASGMRIVPFTLTGIQSLWKELPWPDRWMGKVGIQLHPPVDPEDYRALRATDAVIAMTAEVRRRVASALDYPDSLAEVNVPPA